MRLLLNSQDLVRRLAKNQLADGMYHVVAALLALCRRPSLCQQLHVFPNVASEALLCSLHD